MSLDFEHSHFTAHDGSNVSKLKVVPARLAMESVLNTNSIMASLFDLDTHRYGIIYGTTLYIMEITNVPRKLKIFSHLLSILI